ncbi:recombinase family protein [Bacillus chungangensis]|uniref:DNA invertase Pin-like site-specific DNA recombinase n=1 Tax=Bacillus chungangensis TaxID=587633 RepID=A0ABT9WMJ3_9BACI|nr:recombinase family protein [Bacillus chungangensis]MDQ0174471.1 DNA invertase Pin-like site-specific DNA recombinase [Bacillus chungangensis]
MFFQKGNEEAVHTYHEFPYLVYVRVSTDKDEQVSSPQNQVDICRNWLEKNDFEWNKEAIVFDDGISGTVLLDRPAMQLVLEKARSREIKMVVFKSIHRLARDMRDALEIKETLIAHSVRLVTIEEGYDSLYEGKNDMKFEMFSMFAAQYPKTLSVSISGALAAKVRRGEHLGQIPYGFKSKNKKLVIDEEIAPTIRKIFYWYNHTGLGFKLIVHKLNDELEKGNVVPPKRSNKWQLTTVRSIIKNPAYAGIFIHNRYTKIKIGGRKKQIQNPPEKWNIYENHHPAIVSVEQWKKANKRKFPNYRTKITPWNELRSLMKCSECGSNMVILQSSKKKKDGSIKEWKYLKCSAYRRGGKTLCVNHTPITYENARSVMIKRLLRLGRRVHVHFENTLYKQKQKEIRTLENKMINLKEKSAGLIDLYLDKLISKVEFQKQRQAYASEIEEIRNKIIVLQHEEENSIDVESVEEAFKQLERYEKDLHHAMKELIQSIMVHPDGKIDIHYSFK